MAIEVQVFGTKRSADTRKALRFFAERRVKAHFVDLSERAASVGELRRFAQRCGVDGLIDRKAKRFAELGLGSASYSDDFWLKKAAEEPLILRVPLTRCGPRVTVGLVEDEWRDWVEGKASR
ncbi:MAG: hypothetical protein MNPFHGCM_00108 [Gemmatimonadaceae bacterium]|nr:hypothetical protein [Gemmatimonadaceae bacterium]